MSTTSAVLEECHVSPQLPIVATANDKTKILKTVIWYLADNPLFETEKPFYSNIPFDHPDSRQTNLDSDSHDVDVADIRGFESKFDLEEDGFQIVRNEHPLNYDCFVDPYWIQEHYYPVVEGWLRTAIQREWIEKIYIYDHTIRRRNPNIPAASRGTVGALQPVPAAHVDHSHSSGPTRVRVHLKEEDSEHLMSYRYQIVNVWQPLFGPIQDWPLAICEPQSVAKEDLVPTDLIYPHYFGEIYSLKANTAHKWHYLSNQIPQEVILFKCFDSEVSSKTRFVPHCGIANPEAPEGSRPRESIEFRTLIFYKPQGNKEARG